MTRQLRYQLLLVLGALIMVTACGNQEASEDGNVTAEQGKKTQKPTVVAGTFSGIDNQPVYLELLKPNSIEKLDTVTTDANGAFSFEVIVEQPGYYRVGLSDQNSCVLILSPDEKVEVTADGTSIYKTYQVTGSLESERLFELNKIISGRDSIGMLIQQAQLNQDKALFNQAMAAYQGIMVQVSQDLKTFIDQDPGRMSSLAAVQNLDPGQDFPYFIKVVDALEGTANGNPFFDAMKQQVQRSRKLAVGSEAPDFTLPQPEGEELSLSDLRGKYVLIDFWASWCGPCRRENPNVVRVYEEYKNKGFEILGVSLDKNRGAWLAAIEQDGLGWKHVSDLKYWQSAVVPEYQVQGIPLTYLVDPEGKIVAKNLRGPSLESKLAEIFTE